MRRHRNKTHSRMSVVIITVLYNIPAFESVLLKNVLLKIVPLYIGCGNLVVNVDQQHNLKREIQKQAMYV